jgi:hypothetical protein
MSREFISLGNDRLQKAKNMLVGFEKEIPQVVARAINRSIENARSNVVREVRDRYNVRAKDIRTSIKISRANKNYPTAVLSSTGGPLPTMAFQVRPGTVNGKRRTPITVSVKKGQSEKLDRAFIAMVGGKTGVYERIGQTRLPIRQMYGPSVPQMIGNDEIVKEIADKARAMLDDRLDHEIKRVLDGALK